jgi:hypothetical protein
VTDFIEAVILTIVAKPPHPLNIRGLSPLANAATFPNRKDLVLSVISWFQIFVE